MTPQTPGLLGRKHRHLKVKKNGLLYYLLRKPVHWSGDLKKVEASHYQYSPLIVNGKETGWWYLSTLSVLHRWTGLTLVVTDG